MSTPQHQVLVVCKSPVIAERIAARIADNGTHAQPCNSMGLAIKMLRDQPYDMVLMEAFFGGASGVDFLKEARKRLPGMLRVLIENKPLEIPYNQLINEAAPVAVVDEQLDGAMIRDLLDEHRASKGQPPAPSSPPEPASLLSAQENPEIPPLPGGEDESGERQPLSEAEKFEFITQLSVQLNAMMEDPGLSLPVLPELALRVRELMDDHNADFESIADMVEVEQGMSSRILQVANSPIYAGMERIRNLQGAVGRLGIRETRNIIQLVIAQNLFQTQNRFLMQLMKDLWLHSLCVAYSNEIIAQRLEITESQDYFMMGLLHDIGKLLVIHLTEMGGREGRWDARLVDLDIMQRLMLMRHNDTGARLIQKWHYPTSFQEVVRLHNDSVNIHTREENVVVTHTSNLFARKLGYSLLPYVGDPLTNKDLANRLNMDDATREDLEVSLREMTEKIRRSCLAS